MRAVNGLFESDALKRLGESNKVNNPSESKGLNEAIEGRVLSETSKMKNGERDEMNDDNSAIVLRKARHEKPRVIHAEDVNPQVNNFQVR
jgi:hypothetical protein